MDQDLTDNETSEMGFDVCVPLENISNERKKSNKCSQCNYASFQAGNLRRHLKTHSGEKSNKCNQCDYASSQASALKTHLKRHSGEKSNKCDQCDYACADPSSLRTHLRMHSGEKSNRCDQCDYASYQAGNLRTHLKTHSGSIILAQLSLTGECRHILWRWIGIIAGVDSDFQWSL